ncbi:hypothetical protein cyc_06093 [Cyclospora cayetanensis]|uniref:Uncharacterized protein n=1 Tax=Cyclospora cayetanensis TaxID=88456 RepID=A0A1D3D2W2_9EIME|nr:hypothetical protein cyc_06093 [Cyclospora cayetanensis]
MLHHPPSCLNLMPSPRGKPAPLLAVRSLAVVALRFRRGSTPFLSSASGVVSYAPTPEELQQYLALFAAQDPKGGSGILSGAVLRPLLAASCLPAADLAAAWAAADMDEGLLTKEGVGGLQILQWLCWKVLLRWVCVAYRRRYTCDKRLSMLMGEEVEMAADELLQLRSMATALQRQLIREKQQLAAAIDRRREFEALLQRERVKLHKLQEARRTLELERISAHRDVQHYQEDILFLQQQVAAAEADLRALADVLPPVRLAAANQPQDASYGLCRSALDLLKSEKEALAKEEKQIAEMQALLQRLRREKTEGQSQHAALQERLRQVVGAAAPRASTIASSLSSNSKVVDELSCFWDATTALPPSSWRTFKPPIASEHSLSRSGAAGTAATALGITDYPVVASTTEDSKDLRRHLEGLSVDSVKSDTAFVGVAAAMAVCCWQLFWSSQPQAADSLASYTFIGAECAYSTLVLLVLPQGDYSQLGTRQTDTHKNAFGEHHISADARNRRSASRDRQKNGEITLLREEKSKGRKPSEKPPNRGGALSRRRGSAGIEDRGPLSGIETPSFGARS